jgi:pilus assembly protein CpaB
MAGNKLALILALICATIASFIVYRTIKENGKPKVIEVPKTAVVFAKSAIPARTQITADQVELKAIPKVAVNKDVALKLEDVIGTISKSDILMGEQVNVNRLVRKGESLDLSFLIPSGMRAITIAVNEVAGVAGFIKPGEKVDVIGTLDSKNSGSDSVSWTVLQDVEVLAVAQEMGDPVKDNKNQTNKGSEAKVGTSVTLCVTPFQAQKIALAEEKGVLRLTLRPVLQEKQLNILPVRESNLIPSGSVYRPSPQPQQEQPGRKVEIIVGTKSQVITVY